MRAARSSTMGRAAAAAVLGLALAALSPAVAQAATSVSVNSDGQILVVGDSNANRVSISDQSDPLCPGGPPCYRVDFDLTGTATAPCISSGTGTALCPRAGVNGISGIGREGNDTFVISDFVFVPAVPADLVGGPGDDHLTGTARGDDLFGGLDDDEIHGGGGNDRLSGNPGVDRIFGAKGNDGVAGGPGADDLFGGLGNDTLWGQSGKDLLDGLQGRDRCIGGRSRDAARRCEKLNSIP